MTAAKPLIELGVGEHFQRSPHGVHIMAEQGTPLSLEIVLITTSKYSIYQECELIHL